MLGRRMGRILSRDVPLVISLVPTVAAATGVEIGTAGNTPTSEIPTAGIDPPVSSADAIASPTSDTAGINPPAPTPATASATAPDPEAPTPDAIAATSPAPTEDAIVAPTEDAVAAPTAAPAVPRPDTTAPAPTGTGAPG